MAISYNTTTKKITLTASSTVRNLYDDSMSVFSGTSYMRYSLPMQGNVKDALYTLINGWDFASTASVDYLTSSALQDAAGDNVWGNVQTLGSIVSGTTLYINQGGTVSTASHTGHLNQLLKVRSGGSDINAKALTVFARKFQQTYSQFSTTGGAFISTIPLATAADPNLTIDATTLAAYSDLSITWATIYRSAFDGASTTKYTLNGALNNSATTVTVNEAIDASVPASGSLQIDGEVITYTGKTTHGFTGCTRGQYRTTAASHLDQAMLSTNLAQYGVLIHTSNAARTAKECYNWVQYQLLQTGDIDSLSGGHPGYITDALLAMSGSSITTQQGVWMEGFVAADKNNLVYTDNSGTSHTPPLTVAISVNTDSALTGGVVSVFTLDTAGLTSSTYGPANIVSTLINQAIASTATSTSTSITYTADTPARVVVRKPGYQQFELFASITNQGLTVTAQNPADGAY